MTATALVDHGPDAVVVDDVTKRYGPRGNKVLALEHVSLTVRAGEFVVLLGASGCGKTTLLNLIAGLERPARGEVAVHLGRPALLVRDGALFPWLSATGNVELALKLAGRTDQHRPQTSRTLLESVHLAGMGHLRPHQMSPGMRHRVALARALAQGVPLLLMDAPFVGLDAITKGLLHEELEALWRDRNLTVLFATDDVSEAVRLADRVLLMTSRPGRIADEFQVDLARPRRLSGDEAQALTATLGDRLNREVRRHAEG